ncbi:hypothetical protein [Ruegeria sp. YS9]|uniref:hypothetical protein n=1 Tax=Ruegeria sp. YS9 TaxID=2966453 RepID=UPI00214BE4B9|nr:hypothetical protein [Ruegeria sp. YS9]UUV07051.1 hypothetical protein NOR97_04635 [Ruegeria sp. YS9]
MGLNRKNLIATFGVALALLMAMPMSADAGRQRTKNTIGGALIGAGVGALVGGSGAVQTGAIVGAIAGATK